MTSAITMRRDGIVFSAVATERGRERIGLTLVASGLAPDGRARTQHVDITVNADEVAEIAGRLERVARQLRLLSSTVRTGWELADAGH